MPPPSPRDRRVLLIASLCCAMTVLETNVVAIVLPAIARDLQADFAQVEWVVSSYLLCFCSLLLPAGTIADRYGRRRVLLAGLALFGATSLACALATTTLALCIARASQGIGAAFLLAPALAIIGHRYHEGAARDRAWAFWGTMMGLTMVLSPMLGGLVSSLLGWRWAFAACLPILALLGAGAWRWIEESTDPALRPLDPPGIASFMLAMFGVVLGLVEGPATGWTSLPALAGFTLALTMGGLFVAIELRRRQPMLDLRLLRQPCFVGALLAMAGYAISAQVMAAMLPQYLQNGLGLDALHAGFSMLPFAGAMLLFPHLGRGLGRHLPPWKILALGLGIAALGNALTAAGAWQATPWLAILGMAVIGAGGGLLNGETPKAIIGAAPRDRAGMASGISATARFTGILVGFTLLGGALSTGVRSALARLQDGATVTLHADGIATGSIVDPALAAIARTLYGQGFAVALSLSSIAAFVIAILVAMLMGSRLAEGHTLSGIPEPSRAQRTG